MQDTVKMQDLFGVNVFGMAKMRERLPRPVFEKVKTVMENGGELTRADADVVAKAMKDWAIEKGATHYTHWFQPLTGITAEKHDSFLNSPDKEGHAIMEFSGKELIMGEPDASSFPSGGLRSTFEARGYTTWDVTSPAFLKHTAAGYTLCIPTAFCSYTGEALDKKTPLLRSIEAVNTQCLRILRLFGDTTTKKVIPNVGAEQEYFLVDKEKFLNRPDLIFTGHTLFGAPAPKGQEMEDHYFGVIRERVGAFMKDLNTELWELGVPAKTQHNEAAPAQHELAPIYEDVNIACDHNQIIMEAMKRVAGKHGMQCLLHEKPFAGVNGSGKHNNWSLSTDGGENLLNPGDSPEKNIQFLLVLSCILKAVDVHADLLRQSAADVGNDHRLGENEAPPAIISVFLGDQLTDVVQQVIDNGTAEDHIRGGVLRTGVSTLPDVRRDATDRNRTSPFAFTGNKFEFRMVGSADSIGGANTTLNAIVAEAFADAANRLEKAEDFKSEVLNVIQDNITEHQRIIFNGNGYSPEWVTEAANRGLPNIPSTIEAAAALTTDKAVALFERFGIFTKSELLSREEIIYDTYAKMINIEALTMVDMASRQILPVCMRSAGELAKNVQAITACGLSAAAEAGRLREITELINEADSALAQLKLLEKQADTIQDTKQQAFFYKDVVKPAMKALRRPCDALEMLIDRKEWPFPTYEDLMFEG